MSVNVSLFDTVTPRLRELHAAVGPARGKALMGVLGKAAEVEYRRWFLGRNSDSPNRSGFPRQNFWNRLRSATAYEPALTTSGSATVVIADPAINAKVHGGTWGAKEAKNLAIPLRAEAYGKSPKGNWVAGLRFIPNRKTGDSNVTGWLAVTEGETTTYWWRLQKTVTVAPDPRALPPREQIAAVLVAAASGFILRDARRGLN